MGDRVFIFMPSDKQERAYKLANAISRPLSYHALFENGVEATPVDKPGVAVI